MALMDSSAKMLSGGVVDMKAATATTAATDDALKDLLGSDRYELYQDFEKTLADRVQVQQLNQQLAGEGVPLEASQSKALIKIMSEEREGLPNSGSGNGTSVDIDDFSRKLDEMNQRVYDRANTVLTPRQLSAFAIYQKNMATAQAASLKVSQEMLKSNQ